MYGGSGAGKSASYVVPNALQLLGSYVFTDPKGELYDMTAGYFRSKGYDVKVLILALPDQYIEHGNIDVLRKETGLDSQSMTERIIKAYKEL